MKKKRKNLLKSFKYLLQFSKLKKKDSYNVIYPVSHFQNAKVHVFATGGKIILSRYTPDHRNDRSNINITLTLKVI